MTTIWKLKNIAPITKMSIESTVATASLTAAITTAITTVLIATKVIAGRAALVASPAAIAGLFIAAIYFAAAACASYQQMHENEEISELKASVREVKEKIEGLATKDELNNKLNADALGEEVKKLLPNLLLDPNVVTADVKTALGIPM